MNLFKKTFLFVSVAAVTTACNSGANKESKSDSTPAATAAAQPAPMKDEAFLREKVADFAKWKPVFDSGVSHRLEAGLHDHIVGQGDADPNTVQLVLYVDDTAKASAMSKSAELKAIRKSAGFISMIDADYVHRVFVDTAAGGSSKARVMITHKVKDFDAWKKVFDEHKQARINNGLADRMVGYSMTDKNKVTIVCVVTDEAKAKAFMKSKDLMDKMKSGGVEGAPTIFFYHVVDSK